MMLIMILGISLAFLWLMIESKWLTIRLPQYYRKTTELEALIEVIPLLVMIGFICAAVASSCFGRKKLGKKKKKGVNWFQRLKVCLHPRQWRLFALWYAGIFKDEYTWNDVKKLVNTRKTKKIRDTPG